jgi:uncharacterized repeat protein (TIGR03803 family)
MLVSFDATNGAYPEAALTLGDDGNFYGTSAHGGTNAGGYGTIFQIRTNGALTTLVSFALTNGAYPEVALTRGNDGNFYGTTAEGGIFYGYEPNGTVFQVTPGGTLTTLVYSFIGTSAPYYYPSALTLGNDGTFYGTTQQGDAYNFYGGSSADDDGTVFQFTTNGGAITLFSFSGTNGAYPESALTYGNDGNLYGTTSGGGANHSGTIFQVTTNGTLTTLVFFTGTNGANPAGALTLGNDGNFYGTTLDGGSKGYGSIFQVTTNGTLRTLFFFSATNGADPEAALTLGTDGNFYGTTANGGENGYGTIFQFTTNGTLTTLVSFSGTNGASPRATLTLGPDGSFYGTTYEGGSNGYGTIYHLLLTPGISTQPQSQTNNAGATITLFCDPILQPVSFQWQKNGTNLVDGGNISGATTSTLTIANISDTDAATYSVVVSNDKGSTQSSSAILTVIDPPTIAAQPTNLLVLPGTNVVYSVTLTGTPPFSYQWQFDRVPVYDATNADYAIPLVASYNAGNYLVVVSNPAGGITSSNAALTVVLSPTSQTNYAGSTATFSAPSFGPVPLNYQWQKDGTNLINRGNIAGATNSTLIIAAISESDVGSYGAVVGDGSSDVTTSNATLAVNDNLFFAVQPQNQAVFLGNSVTFNVIVYGEPPFIFQWYDNQLPVGSNGTGSNVASLTLTNVDANQAGYYSVHVINSSGNLWSSAAYLTVIVPPTLSLQLLSGYPVLNLYGALDNNYVVQYTASLANTNWINLVSLTNLSTSPYQFLDPSGVGQSARFYRAFFSQ